MKNIRFLLASVAAAVLLAACNSGDDTPQFRSVVSFGDSISDPGAYNVATIAALGGGKFTVNGPEGKVWTEFLAESLGAAAQCAAQTGLLANNGVAGAPVENFADCNNYAQGSSRVSSSGTGPNGVALQPPPYDQMNLGFMAVSLKAQFDAHLAKNVNGFSGAELVTVNGGGNDLFVQLGAVGAAFAGGATAVGAATIAGWPPSVVGIVFSGGAPASAAAADAAVAAMSQAGSELAGYINTLVVGRGANFVIVRNLGDVNVTPFGLSLDAGTQGLITAMTMAYNGQLSAGLEATPGVLLYDDYAQSAAVVADPAKFGFTNITTRACGPNDFGAPNGPSIICNATNLIAGDSSHFAFSDDVHPTPYAAQQTVQAVLSQMVSVGWR